MCVTVEIYSERRAARQSLLPLHAPAGLPRVLSLRAFRASSPTAANQNVSISRPSYGVLVMKTKTADIQVFLRCPRGQDGYHLSLSLSLLIYIYIYIYVDVYVYVSVSVSASVSASVSVSVYVYVFLYATSSSSLEGRAQKMPTNRLGTDNASPARSHPR